MTNTAGTMRLPIVFLTLALLALACSALAAPTPTPVPTGTPLPSATPLPTLTATPIIALPLGTPGLIPTSETASGTVFSCDVRTQGIKNGAKFDPKERFDMAWKVANTGDAVWDPASVEFIYWGGSKLHVTAVGQLDEIVGPGQRGLLTTDMIAPRPSGEYTTIWALRHEGEVFCRVTLTIIVR